MVSTSAVQLLPTIMQETAKLSKCRECQSDKHTAALHPNSPNNPVIRSKEQGDTQLHGEEASNFTTTCTEACGSAGGSKSCSKICLPNV